MSATILILPLFVAAVCSYAGWQICTVKRMQFRWVTLPALLGPLGLLIQALVAANLPSRPTRLRHTRLP